MVLSESNIYIYIESSVSAFEVNKFITSMR